MMSPRLTKFTALAGLGLAFALAFPSNSFAGKYRYKTVTAHSRYANGSITAPIRRGRLGVWEVRLPGGTWLPCFGGCRFTLRQEALDFWETLNEEGGGPGRG